MTSLIFLAALLALVVLVIRLVVKLARRKPAGRSLAVIAIIVVGYGLGWAVFKLTQKVSPVPFGTQVCFDDWCATVTAAEKKAIGDSLLIALHMEMINNARGIAQTPSEPRVHLVDDRGNIWAYSVAAQKSYEKQNGPQPGMGHRLELHQSMETVLVFAVPPNAAGLSALIEEGPWITGLLFPVDEQVFLIR
jgi:hypothetical protein